MNFKKIFVAATFGVLATVLTFFAFTPTAEQIKKAKEARIEEAAQKHMKAFEETTSSGAF